MENDKMQGGDTNDKGSDLAPTTSTVSAPEEVRNAALEYQPVRVLGPGNDVVSAGAYDVLAERRRQVEVEGWTPERDDKYVNCELARAAATYATCSHIEQLKLCGEQVWPWHPDWWKRSTYRRDLTKAGALILAEIERLDRDTLRTTSGKGEAA